MIHERPLQRLRGRAFDRLHGPPFYVYERDEAGYDRVAVDDDGARTTLPFATPLLRSRETALLAQYVEQPPHRMGVDVDLFPVEPESHC